MHGCNLITCDCGHKMCYLCKITVKGYQHFYGQGGEASEERPCPLWSENDALHDRELADGLEAAEKDYDDVPLNEAEEAETAPPLAAPPSPPPLPMELPQVAAAAGAAAPIGLPTFLSKADKEGKKKKSVLRRFFGVK